MSDMLNRRKFIRGTTLSAAGLILGNSFHAFSKQRTSSYSKQVAVSSSFDLMKQVMNYRKIDAYANAFSSDESAKNQLDLADRLGIEKLIISVPIARKMGDTPDEILAYNDLVLKAVKRCPDRLAGQFTLHPTNGKESLEEMKRCIGEGMVGMKLYNQFKINNPLVYPIIEQFIKFKMIIHVHGESQIGVGGHRMKHDVHNTPTISVPEDFADIAKRYPEAMFQYAHVGGGGDWEYACKKFIEHPNIYVDTGGSNNSENMVDFAVENLGEDRVFFGCDGSFYQGVGNILGSRLLTVKRENFSSIIIIMY